MRMVEITELKKHIISYAKTKEIYSAVSDKGTAPTTHLTARL
jgi:hypothetical protein